MKTKDDTIDLLVTCPKWNYTHTHTVDEGDMPNADGSLRRERYYNFRELEKLMGVSRSTLKRWVYEGKLTAVKQGRQSGGAPWYVSETSLHNFREKHKR